MTTIRPSNQILASLPAEMYEALVPQLELRRLNLEEELSRPNQIMRAVYFPLSGVISLVGETESGESIEAMLVGKEGVVGFWAALGVPAAPWRTIVQAEGEALVMGLDSFTNISNREAGFRDSVLAYYVALLVATSQSVVCNRFHGPAERTARWLLLMQDRVESEEFKMTHAFMGLMLGVHRPAVTVALRTLSEAGLVKQMARAKLRILDRRGLEEAACECYARAKGLPSLS